jgi:hypothetical protein
LAKLPEEDLNVLVKRPEQPQSRLKSTFGLVRFHLGHKKNSKATTDGFETDVHWVQDYLAMDAEVYHAYY